MLRSCLLASLSLGALHAIAQPRANPAGPDQFICGNAATMQADPLSSGEVGVWTVLLGTASFANQSSPTTLVVSLSNGENVLRWTIYGSDGTTSDQVSIWCYSSASPAADAGPDQTVPPWPGSVQLSGSVPIAPAACFWTILSGSGTFSDPTDPQALFTAPGIGTNVLQWSCDNGPCTSTFDSVVIEGVVGIGEADPQGAQMRYDADLQGILIDTKGNALDLALFDARGRLVQQSRISAGSSSWILGDLPQGIYTVRSQHAGAAATMRFAVSR
jgi:hypothetical protein